MPKIPAPTAKSPPSSLRRLTTTAERSTRAAAIELALLGGGGQDVALLDERALRHEVLAPGGEPEAEEEQAGAQGAAEDPGVPVLPVGGAEAGDEHDGHHEDERDDRPRPGWGSWPRRRGAGRSGWRSAWAPWCGSARASLVLVAHERSPIQKQMRARPPTPSSRATKPSATGPTPPRPAPPGLAGCWMLLGHVGHDVTDLGVGQVAGEPGHVGRPDPHGLGHLLGRDLPVLQRGRVGAEGQGVAGAGDGVAGGAVQGEEVGADREVGPVEVRGGHGGHRGVQRVDVGRHLERLRVGQPGWLALGLDGLDVGGRHAAGGDPEVDGGRTHALEVGADGGLAVGGDAVGLGAVAAGAGLVEEQLAGRGGGRGWVGVGDGAVAVAGSACRRSRRDGCC